MLINLVNGKRGVGARVRLTGKDRNGDPPLPFFVPVSGEGK